jgi:hypothetical protein
MFSPYRAVNTLRLGYKTSQLMLYSEIIAVCSQIHTKHTNTLCEQNVEFLDAFEKLRKATIGFVTSVRLSVGMEQLGSHWTDFDETDN